jgi:hypothetical protein
LVPLGSTSDGSTKHAGNFTIVILLMKGMIGLAIVILPQTATTVGYLGYFFGNIIAGFIMVFLITLIISTSVARNYTGKR